LRDRQAEILEFGQLKDGTIDLFVNSICCTNFELARIIELIEDQPRIVIELHYDSKVKKSCGKCPACCKKIKHQEECTKPILTNAKNTEFFNMYCNDIQFIKLIETVFE